MLSAFQRTKKRAFTLIELIVVIVLLGLLAGISVPTFQRVIANSQLEVDTASMQTLGRAAAADGAFSEGEFDLESIKSSIASTSGGGKTWVYQPTSTKFGEVSASISPDKKTLQLSSVSTSGDKCIIVNVTGGSPTTSVVDRTGEGCAAVGDNGETEEPGSGELVTPSNVRGTVDGDNLSVNLTWSGSSVSYTVERKSASNDAWVPVGENLRSGERYSDTTVLNGETYVYRVVGFDRNGVSSGYSAESANITIVPAAVTGVNVEDAGLSEDGTGQNVTISWDQSANASGYYVYINDGKFLVKTLIGSGSTSTTVTLPYDSAHKIVVDAFNVGGSAKGSTPVDYKVIPAPATLEVSNLTSSIRLTWQNDNEDASYSLKRSTSENMSGSVEVYTGTSKTFSDSDVEFETGYYYQVTVTTGNGSNVSNVVRGSANSPIPAQPGNLKAETSGDQVTLTWDAVENINGYYVFKDGLTIETVMPGNTSATVAQTPGSSATYTVKAYVAAGASTPASVEVTVAPATPTEFKAVFNQVTKKVTLSWNASAGATSYDVSVNGSVSNQSGTSLVIDAPDGSVNTYSVSALNAGGASAPATQTVTPPPLAPENFTVTMNGSAATLAWTPSATATGYLILNDLGQFEQIIAGGDVSSYSTTVAAGSTANFTLFATNSNGRSAAVYASGTSIPANVPMFTGSTSGTTSTLTWGAADKASGYYLYTVNAQGAENLLATLVGNTLTYSHSVAAGATTQYRIRAYNATGVSATSATSTTAAPGQVVLSSSVTDDTMNVVWGRHVSATGYIAEYRKTTDAAGVWINGGTLAASANSFSPPKALGVTYQVRVRAFNAGGQGAWSALRENTIRPSAPVLTGVSVPANGSEATITWNGVAGASSYVLYVNGNVTTLGIMTTSATYEIPAGTSVSFTVRAVNAGGNSEPSNALTGDATPGAPTLKGSVNGNITTLTWANVEGATAYDVYRNNALHRANATSGGTYGLADGESAVYTVRAKNAKGASAMSNSVTLLATPGVPTVSSAASANGLNFTWAAVTSATNYAVQWRYAGETTWNVLADRANTSFLPTQVDGQTYEVQVRARNASGYGAWSSTKTQSFRPGAPTLTSVDVPDGGARATINWTPMLGATGYVVYANTTLIETIVGGSTSSTTYDVPNGHTQSITVYAQNAGGRSAASNAIAATGAPSPVSIIGSINDKTAVISWGGSNGASGYDVYKNGLLARINAVSGGSFTLADGESADFTVRAKNAAGASAASNTITLLATPGAPTVTSAASQNALIFTWAGMNGAASYESQWRFAGESAWNAGTEVTALRYDPPKTDGQTYEVQIRSKNATGVSAWSATKTQAFRPAAPTDVSALVAANSNTATVSWSKSFGATSYELYVNGVKVNQTIGDVSSTTYALGNGQTGSFALKAVNAAGAGALSSSAQAVATPGTPTNVGVMKISGSDNSDVAQVFWAASTGATQYRVYSNGILQGTVQAPTSYYEVPMTPGQTKSFTVSAVNASGESAQSGATAAVTAADVTGLTAGSASAGVTKITWTALAGATDYSISVSGAAAGNITTTSIGKVTSWSLPDSVSPNTNVTVTLYAKNAAGTSTGKSITVRTASAAPTNVRFTSKDVVAWDASAGATGYIVYNIEDFDETFVSTTSATLPAGWGNFGIGVIAVNPGGESWPTLANRPEAPSEIRNVTVSSTSGTNGRVGWTRPTNYPTNNTGPTAFLGYRVTLSGGAGAYTNKIVAGTGTLVDSPGVTIGANYTISITPYNAGGDGPTYTSVVAFPPLAPTVTWGTAVGQTKTITWPAVTGAAKYIIGDVGTDGVVMNIVDLGTARTYTFTDGTSASRPKALYAVASSGVRSTPVTFTWNLTTRSWKPNGA